MATSFSTALPDLIFSTQLKELEYSTNLDIVTLSLCEDKDWGTLIFSTTVYPVGGTAVFYDIASVVELYMQKKGYSSMRLTVELSDSASNSLIVWTKSVIYCKYFVQLDAKSFVSNNFLTTMSYKRTFRNSTEYLSIYSDAGSLQIEANCIYRNNIGKTLSATISLAAVSFSQAESYTIALKYDDIVDNLKKNNFDAKKLLAYTVLCNGRAFTFYVQDVTPEVSFTFRNCFNVLETVSLSAVTTTKTKVERSIAVLSTMSCPYDLEVTKEYEVQSAPLTYDEAQWIEQLFMSPCVWLGADKSVEALPMVIVTDSTCEISDTNTDSNSVKFSWRFAEAEPHIHTMNMPDDRIHKEQFTHQYN